MKLGTGAGGVLSSAGVGLLSLLAGILLLPLVFASIGAAPYGAWLVLVSIAAFLQYADLGVGTAMVHFGSRARAGADARNMGDYLSAGLIWSAAAAVVILPSFTYLAQQYLMVNRAAAHIDVREAAWLVPLAVVATGSIILRPYAAALTGSGLLPLDRANQAAGVLLRVAGTVIVCLVSPSIVALAAVETAALILPSALALVAVHARGIAQIRVNRRAFSTLRFMLRYSIKAFGVAAVGAALLQAGTLIAGLVLGPTYASYYNAAFRVYSAARQVLTWVIEPFRSVLSRLYAVEGDRGNHVLNSLTFASFLVSSCAAVTFALTGEALVRVWLGDSTPVREISACITVLLAGLAINSLQIPLGPAGDAMGRPGVFLPMQLLWLLLSVVGSVLLMPWYGILGGAAALSVPLLVIVPLYVWRAHVALRLDVRRWAAAGVWPVVWSVLLPGAAFVGAGMLLGALASDSWVPLTLCGTYALVQFAIFWFGRNRLPLRQLRETLRTGL